MTNSLHDVQRRHDFVLLFDVQDGNPNGDPDCGNLPRIDPETMHGLVTDVCLKRKVRNHVDAFRGTEARYKIYVGNRGFLEDHQQRAYEAVGARRGDNGKVAEARQWMCANFYDVRTFGAVMPGKKADGFSCGAVRGPVQLTFARSIDPIMPVDLAITRLAVNSGSHSGRQSDKPTMGPMCRKAIVPYGLYRAFGFINPALAAQTGFCDDDLRLFWQALQEMWETDRSAARGLMSCQGVYVFSHRSKLGNAPADRLLSLVTDLVRKRDAIAVARSVQDYVLPTREQLLDAMCRSGIKDVDLTVFSSCKVLSASV